MTNVIDIIKKEPELSAEECIQKLEEDLGTKCFIENPDFDPNIEESTSNEKQIVSLEFKVRLKNHKKIDLDMFSSLLKKMDNSKLIKIPVLEDLKIFKNEHGQFSQPVFNQDACYIYDYQFENYYPAKPNDFFVGFKVHDGRTTRPNKDNEIKLESLFNRYFFYIPYHHEVHYKLIKNPIKQPYFVYKNKDTITVSKIFINEDHYVIRSENPNYPDEVIPLNDGNFYIIGVLAGCAFSQSQANSLNSKKA